MTPPNPPKDLGVKIGTPEEVFWTGIKEKAKEDIGRCKHEIEINEALIVLSEKKITTEKGKV